MFEIQPQIVPSLATIVLAMLSYTLRWIAGFQLEGAGSDFALVASSLQLSQIFARMNEADFKIEVLQLDVLLFVILLMFWFLSIRIVKSALQTRRRIFSDSINPFTLSAFLLGIFAIILEIFWRIQFG